MEIESYSPSAFAGTKGFGQPQSNREANLGFGALSDERTNKGFDLNEELIRNKPATYFMRVTGNSMVNAGIFDGDIVIVDRSIKPQSGKIVIAVIDGEMLIRRLDISMNRMRLIPETPKLATIEISEFSNCAIWGVVTFNIHAT